MTVFLDSCTLIYWFETVEPWRSQVVAALRSLRQQAGPGTKLGMSRLAILECLVKPVRDGNQDLEDRYRQFFASHDLQVVELKPAVVERALNLRADYRLKTADALQAASALGLRGDVIFVTGDETFTRVPNLQTKLLV